MSRSKWKIVVASVRGSLHAARDLPCQDAYAFRVFETSAGETLALVVSDGAGSAAFAQIGARLICDFFVSKIAALHENNEKVSELTEDFVLQFIAEAQKEIARKSENQNLSDYACTFLVAVTGADFAVFAQIGDGAIVYSAENAIEEFRLFRLPQHGEYANSTNFITDSNAADNLQFEKIETRVEELAIFTDGLQRLALDFQTKQPHDPFFRSMLAPLRAEIPAPNLREKLSEFLDSPKINERTDDDKTLILASRKKK